MNEIQDKILDVFLEFKRICDEHGLIYYAIGGTCIGAIRHKGFIPWDDDLDVAMPSDDYFRFQHIAKEKLKDDYEIMGPFTCKHYTAAYIKLQNKNTTFIESHVQDYPDRYGGVYIDIFPIFGMPKETVKRKLLEYKCSIYNCLNIKLRFPLKEHKSLKGVALWIICLPLHLIHHYDYYTKKMLSYLWKHRFDESDSVIFCWRKLPNKHTTYKNIFFYEDFKNGIEVPFENTLMRVPIGYDRYLTMDFGDYMKLPLEQDRVGRHPKKLVDLNKPYIEAVIERKK